MSKWGRNYPAIEIAATKFTKSTSVDWFLATEGWLCALVGADSSAAVPKLTYTHLTFGQKIGQSIAKKDGSLYIE
jgi:hypothetical protein